jgi:large subunit ribosomal protein L15
MHDFNLHAPAGANKRRRVVGRGQGSGRGTTAGKGNKGQQSRSGGKTYLGFEGGQMPLYRRLAHRGFSNYPFKKTYKAVNIGDLAGYYEDGETVSAASLKERGVSKSRLPVKILGEGDCPKKLIITDVAMSESARQKVVNAGGTVPEPKPDKKTDKHHNAAVKRAETSAAQTAEKTEKAE